MDDQRTAPFSQGNKAYVLLRVSRQAGMNTADLAGWADLVRNGGLALVVVMLILGGIRQWYVWGWVYRQMLSERDEWRDMVVRSTIVIEETARKRR